jgi:hypothetical protein
LHSVPQSISGRQLAKSRDLERFGSVLLNSET